MATSGLGNHAGEWTRSSAIDQSSWGYIPLFSLLTILMTFPLVLNMGRG